MGAWEEGYTKGFDAGFRHGTMTAGGWTRAAFEFPSSVPQEPVANPKTKRKVSAYQRRYKAAFKRVSSRYRTKSGKWKKGGFKSAVRAAHKEARK